LLIPYAHQLFALSNAFLYRDLGINKVYLGSDVPQIQKEARSSPFAKGDRGGFLFNPTKIFIFCIFPTSE
jgi:hypothetical protein